MLDTSTPTCLLTLVESGSQTDYEWVANRELAHGLLKYLNDTLSSNGKTWNDLTGLAAYQGPGSFTGLRIGITVLNTLADSLAIPIVGATGIEWKETALSRLNAGENDSIVLPEYGGEANITTPRK